MYPLIRRLCGSLNRSGSFGEGNKLISFAWIRIPSRPVLSPVTILTELSPVFEFLSQLTKLPRCMSTTETRTVTSFWQLYCQTVCFMYVFICEICICVLPSVLHTAIFRSEFLESVFYAYSTRLK